MIIFFTDIYNYIREQIQFVVPFLVVLPPLVMYLNVGRTEKYKLKSAMYETDWQEGRKSMQDLTESFRSARLLLEKLSRGHNVSQEKVKEAEENLELSFSKAMRYLKIGSEKRKRIKNSSTMVAIHEYKRKLVRNLEDIQSSQNPRNTAKELIVEEKKIVDELDAIYNSLPNICK